MIENKYFILTLPEPAINAILSHCVEKTITNARKLYDGSYVIKLPVGTEIPDILKNKQAYNHSETLTEIEKREIGRPKLI